MTTGPIPEVFGRPRLLAFIQKYLKKIDQLDQKAWVDITPNGTGNSYDFESIWQPYDNSPGWSAPGFMKDTLGFVHLRGLVESIGTSVDSSILIFTLPDGYRPASKKIFGIMGNDSTGYVQARINVTADGEVQVAASTFTPDTADEWVSFEGITFDTR